MGAAMRIGPFRLRHTEPDDPYWEGFINRPPADARNVVTLAMADAEEGSVHPTRTEVHSANVMASHVKELGHYLGIDEVGIVQLAASPFEDDPGAAGPFFGIVSLVQADHDTRTAPGSGGQAPTVKGLFATFNLAAYIREMGYRASRSKTMDAERLATIAGLGTMSSEGRLESPRLRPRVHAAEVIVTELPLEPDAREPTP
jgi:hypothetical protein